MNWEECKIRESESHKKRIWIKESVWLGKRGNKAMNWDDGGTYSPRPGTPSCSRRTSSTGEGGGTSGTLPQQRHRGGNQKEADVFPWPAIQLKMPADNSGNCTEVQ